MKTYAIALLCIIFLAGSSIVSRANSRIVQQEQVTIFIQDAMYNTLGSKTFSYAYTTPCGPDQPGPLSLWFTLSFDSQPTKTLFGDIPLLANVGKTIWISSAAANPSYSTFVVALTDSRNDRLSGTFTLESLLGTVTSSTTRVYESAIIPGGISGDCGEVRIGRIGLRIDSASVTQIPCTVELVPEPGSVIALLGGIGCMAALRRTRRR